MTECSWRGWTLGGIAILSLSVSANAANATSQHTGIPTDWQACFLEPGTSHAPDAAVFFEGLVDRYRRLAMYSDVVRMVQITHRHGERDQRVETELNCTVRDGHLDVMTPARQLRRSFGALPLRSTEKLNAITERQDFWLAPHMSLKFAEKPLESLRPGVTDGFTPTEMSEVTVDEREMVEIELKSGDGLSEDCEARCNLLVNPDSMLIERIQVNQRMADGSTQETTLDIRPRDIVDLVGSTVEAEGHDAQAQDAEVDPTTDPSVEGDLDEAGDVPVGHSATGRPGFGGQGRSTTSSERVDG